MLLSLVSSPAEASGLRTVKQTATLRAPAHRISVGSKSNPGRSDERVSGAGAPAGLGAGSILAQTGLPQSGSGSVRFLQADTGLCMLAPGSVSADVEVSLTGAASAILQTAFRVVNPPDLRTATEYGERIVRDGDLISFSGAWPGVRAGDQVVEVHFGALLLDPATRNPISNAAGLDYYWYPWTCGVVSPPPPTVVTGQTATSTATGTATITSPPPTVGAGQTQTPTLVSTATITATLPTVVAGETATPTVTLTATATFTATLPPPTVIAGETATPTPTEFPTAVQATQVTLTQTSTATATPTPTPTPGATATATNTGAPPTVQVGTATFTATPTETEFPELPTLSPTPTATASLTPTNTPLPPTVGAGATATNTPPPTLTPQSPTPIVIVVTATPGTPSPVVIVVTATSEIPVTGEGATSYPTAALSAGQALTATAQAGLLLAPAQTEQALLPVTGADLANRPLSTTSVIFWQKLTTYAGLLLLGAALVLQGLAKRG